MESNTQVSVVYSGILRLRVTPNVFILTIYLVFGALDSPTRRVRCNTNWIPVVESLHRTAELISPVSWIKLDPRSLDT